MGAASATINPADRIGGERARLARLRNLFEGRAPAQLGPPAESSQADGSADKGARWRPIEHKGAYLAASSTRAARKPSGWGQLRRRRRRSLGQSALGSPS